jgi:hypothetical protein
MTLPTILLIVATTLFLVVERVLPGRSLPHSAGWYVRCLSINLVQLGITLGLGSLWVGWLGGETLIGLAQYKNPILEGLIGWFVGTFVFYW